MCIISRLFGIRAFSWLKLFDTVKFNFGRNIDPCVITQSLWTSSFFGLSFQLRDRRFGFRIFSLRHSAFSWRGRLLQGFLNIFRSECCFCIRCHLFIRTCLRSGIDGRYSVTNSNRYKRKRWENNQVVEFISSSGGMLATLPNYHAVPFSLHNELYR